MGLTLKGERYGLFELFELFGQGQVALGGNDAGTRHCCLGWRLMTGNKMGKRRV